MADIFKTEKLNNFFQKNLIAIAFSTITVLGISVYASSLTGEFIWDDYDLVVNNHYVHDTQCVSRLFTQSMAAGAWGQSYYYRPLTMLVYMTGWRLWGAHPPGYHLLSLSLHIAAAFLFFAVAAGFLPAKPALLAALLFTVHPLHSETVDYISDLGDLLSAVFILGAFLSYMRLARSSRPLMLIVSVASYALGLISKENALVLPLLLLLYHWACRLKVEKEKYLPFLLITLFYLIARQMILWPSLVSFTSLPQRIPGFFAALTGYAGKLFFPFNLYFDYGNRIFGFWEPQALAGLAIAAGFIAWAWRFRRRLPGFAAGWLFLTILPFSNIFFNLPFYMADHYFYLPSLAVFLLMASGIGRLSRFPRGKLLVGLLAAALLVYYGCISVKQNRYWHNELGFYERTLKYTPEKARVCLVLGTYWQRHGRDQEALAYYDKALRLGGTYKQAFYNRGCLLAKLGRFPEAEASYRQAIAADPAYALAYYNLGVLIYTQKDQDQGVWLMRKALALDPSLTEGYKNLGALYEKMGRQKEAARLYEKAVLLYPGDAGAHYSLGAVYAGLGDGRALAELKTAVKINPGFGAAHNDLAVVYASLVPPDWDAAYAEVMAARYSGYKINAGFLQLVKDNIDRKKSP